MNHNRLRIGEDAITENPPRIFITTSELLVVSSIISAACAVLLPAVNVTLEKDTKPPVFAFLVPFYDGHLPLFIVFVSVIGTCCAALLFALCSRVMPSSITRRFPWRKKFGAG